MKFKISIILLAVILFAACVPMALASTAEDVGQAVCTDGDWDYYRFELHQEGQYQLIVHNENPATTYPIQFHRGNSVWFTRTPTAASDDRIWVELLSPTDVISGMVLEAPTQECAEDTPIYEDGVECVGQVFEGVVSFWVDGNEYLTHSGNVSWVVTLDTIWEWQINLDNGIILHVVQSETGNCHVEEIVYPQETS